MDDFTDPATLLPSAYPPPAAPSYAAPPRGARPWPTPLLLELAQRRESGYDVSAVAERLRARPGTSPACDVRKALDELAGLARSPTWPYTEPATYEGILDELPPDDTVKPALGTAELRDRINAGWLGRCAGAGELPSADLDFTVLNLRMLQRTGMDYRASDIADDWLRLLPYAALTAGEQAAYRNLVNGVGPLRAATVDNPYREWIGAQIRGDVFGYVRPGQPRRAALLAYQDASLSHTANGIYAEMWSAALVASAFTAGSHREAVLTSIAHVPQRSRLAEALRWVVTVWDSKPGWDIAVSRMHERLDRYHCQHAIRNAAGCALALLHSGDDFTTAIDRVRELGMATASNAATVGSVAGAFAGRAGIPPHWTTPLADRIRTGLSGLSSLSISDAADQAFALARTYA
ncbi:ADP-ribosylglycohydrolase family protein [Flindersiella endophytica]